MMSKGMMKAGIYLALILVVGVFAVGILAQSVLSLAVAITDTRIYVKTQSGVGIPNARVECYLHGFFGSIPTDPSYTIYTDSSGLAKRTIAQGIYTVIINASGYQEKVGEFDNRVSGEVNPVRTYTFTLDPGGVIPTGFDVNFYLVGSDNKRVSAYVTCNGETFTSDGDGLARFNLEAGSYSVRFHGYYLQSGGVTNPVNFDFTKSVVVSAATTFTVYVETESLINGLPPTEGSDFDLTAIVEWLMGSTIPGVPNWAIAAVLLFLVLRR